MASTVDNVVFCNFYESIVVQNYMLQVYNTVVHNFNGYTPFMVIIKYWLYSYVIKYILIAYFIHNSLNVILHPYVAPPLFPLLTGSHYFVLSICGSAFFLVCSLVCYNF